MPPQPSPSHPPTITTATTNFITSLTARLNIHAALAGEEDHLLNSIWIVLMLLEALIVVIVALRSLFRVTVLRLRSLSSSRRRSGAAAASAAAAAAGKRQTSSGGPEKRRRQVSSGSQRESSLGLKFALGEKDWIVDGGGEYHDYEHEHEHEYDYEYDYDNDAMGSGVVVVGYGTSGNAERERYYGGKFPVTP